MDEFAFLTLMLLINHRISLVLVAICECRILAKKKRESYALIQGANTPSNHASPCRNHMDWRAHQSTKPTLQKLRHVAMQLEASRNDTGQRRWPGARPTGRPTPLVGRPVGASTASPLWREASWRLPNDGSKCHMSSFRREGAGFTPL